MKNKKMNVGNSQTEEIRARKNLSLRERQKRPDKQLYVPKALRRFQTNDPVVQDKCEGDINKSRTSSETQLPDESLKFKSPGKEGKVDNVNVRVENPVRTVPTEEIAGVSTSNDVSGNVEADNINIHSKNPATVQTEKIASVSPSNVPGNIEVDNINIHVKSPVTVQNEEIAGVSTSDDVPGNVEVDNFNIHVKNPVTVQTEEIAGVSTSNDVSQNVEVDNINVPVENPVIAMQIEETTVILTDVPQNVIVDNINVHVENSVTAMEIEEITGISTDVPENVEVDLIIPASDNSKTSKDTVSSDSCGSSSSINLNSSCAKEVSSVEKVLQDSSKKSVSKSDVLSSVHTDKPPCDEEVSKNKPDLVVLEKSEESNSVDGEESWESMFNDDGECLNPDVIKELGAVVGRVSIKVSEKNYSEYQPVSENNSEEYDCIVELHDFPKEFSTQDLVSALSFFQQSSYTLKWVDDCHALALFSTPAMANQALQLNHTFVKIRPVSEGIKESKLKARYLTNVNEPMKPRPTTSAVLARRLVSGALGLKVQTTREQRERERTLLKEAKEKRKLEAKQRQDIWDGVV